MNPSGVVHIVDDDSAVRDALAVLVESAGFRPETHSSAAEFLAAFDPAQVACLLLDVRMPGMDGIALQHELVAAEATIPIIMITAHGDVEMAVLAMKAGALGFCRKPVREQELLDQVSAAIRLHQRRLFEGRQKSQTQARVARLSAREREVLGLIVAGRTNKQISLQLGITVRTVESHRGQVMQKMEADTVAELVRMVVHAGAASHFREATPY